MADQGPPLPHFFGYPEARKAPTIPYQKAKDENPVLRGIPLVIGAWLISQLQFIQKLLWSNAGFGSLRGLEHLKSYVERWEPTVVPLRQPGSLPAPPLDSKSFPSLPSNLPGRYRSITDYHELYLSGKLTPLAVVESLLPLIQRDATPVSHHSVAFVECHAEKVLSAARESTARYKAGAPLSIFDGVPTAIKDETKVAGYLTRQGRKHDGNLFSPEANSSWIVEQWVKSGGIVLGKLNMHELGADTSNNNPNWGTPKNPHNDQYYTGGSSGGAAYAVAAGIVPVALGSDGGGSVRIPSSFCGVYGLKPSHNRIPYPGSTVTVLGPLAATISDLEASYRLFANPDPSNSISSLFASPGTIKQTRTKTIGYCKAWFERADPHVFDACSQALNYYRQDLGYEIVDIELPYLPQGQLAHAFTILAEMVARAHTKPYSLSNWLSGFTPANKVILGVGAQTPAYDYLLAQQLRNMLMQHLAYLYQEHPGLIIVTPASPIAGWPISMEKDLKHGVSDGNMSIRNMEYVWLANFTGNPAISVPVGYVKPVHGNGNIPVGLMAMGEWGAEDQLLQWGREAESWLNEVYPGGRQRPQNWEDVVLNAQGKWV